MISLSHRQAQAASIDCRTCRAGRRNEWCAVLEGDSAGRDRARSARQYLPGELLYREGDGFEGMFCLESGLVAVRKLDAAGHEVLLRMSEPGDAFGYQALFSERGHTSSAEALEPSAACFFPAAAVRKLVETSPAVNLRLLAHAVRDLSAAEERVLETTSQPIRARFANLLLLFKDRYGAVGRDGELTLQLPLSRRDMAAMIGARPESLSRVIKSFQDENLACFANRRVVVPHVVDLRDELTRR